MRVWLKADELVLRKDTVHIYYGDVDLRGFLPAPEERQLISHHHKKVVDESRMAYRRLDLDFSHLYRNQYAPLSLAPISIARIPSGW